VGGVASGFSQELGSAIMIFGSGKAVIYGYSSSDPLDLDWSSADTKVEIFITSSAVSESYVVMKGLMRLRDGLVETVIYVYIDRRMVWIPGPISFIGWF